MIRDLLGEGINGLQVDKAGPISGADKMLKTINDHLSYLKF